MKRFLNTAAIIITALPALADVIPDPLPNGFVEQGRFTGTINGTDVTLITTGRPRDNISGLRLYRHGDHEQLEMFEISASSDFHDPPPEIPWSIRMTLRTDAATDELQLVIVKAFDGDYFTPLMANTESGYMKTGQITLQNIDTAKGGYISFDFSADLVRWEIAAGIDPAPIKGDLGGHIEGHYEGTVPDWATETYQN